MYSTDETSIENANPIELYLFTYNNNEYTYASSQYYQIITINGVDKVFNPEFIQRSENFVLGDANGNVETCTITVSRNNPVALLYQGAPPELDSIRTIVYRKHGENSDDYVQILDGIVSQVTFMDSTAELTIAIEKMLDRYVPRGTLSYFCQNCVYDERCGLDRNNYALSCVADGGFDGLWIYSSTLLSTQSGYYTDGYIQMGDCFRAVKLHQDRSILLKYPIPYASRQYNFTIYPGCNAIFAQCAEKFNNTDNFSGIPYIRPYDPFNTSVGRGAYWVNGNIVYRDTNGNLHTMNV